MTDNQKKELRKRISNKLAIIDNGFDYGETLNVLTRFMIDNADTKEEIKDFIDGLKPYLDGNRVLVNFNSVLKICTH